MVLEEMGEHENLTRKEARLVLKKRHDDLEGGMIRQKWVRRIWE